MIVSRLILKNFKRHAALDVSFEHGSNMIVGHNYRGKSTILQGILLGIFGNAAVPGNAADLVRTGATDFEVQVFFSTGLHVTRSLKNSAARRGGPEATPFARSHTTVNQAMAQELGLDRASFMRIFASEQGSPQRLLDMEGSELQRFLESCIGIEDLDRIVKLSNKQKAKYVAQSEVYAMDLMEREELLACGQTLAGKGMELEGAKKKLAETIEDMDKTHDDARLLEDELHKANQINLVIQKYTERSKAFSDMSLMKTLDLAAPRAKLELLRETRAKQDEVSRLIDSLDKLASQQISLQSTLGNALPAIEDTAELDKQLEEFPAPVLQSLEDVTNLIIANATEHNKVSSSISGLISSLEGLECPTCKRPFDDSEACKEDMEHDLAQLQQRLEELRGEGNTLDVERKFIIDANDKVKAEWGRAIEELKDQRRSMAIRIRDAEKLHERYRLDSEKAISIDNQMHEIRQTLAKLPELVDVKTLVMDIANLQDEIREQEKYNARADANNQLYEQRKMDLIATPKPESLEPINVDEIMGKMDINRSKRRELETSHQGYRDLISKLESEVARLKEAIEKHCASEKQWNDTLALAGKYDNIAKILTTNRSRIISEAMNGIFAVATEFAKACTDGDMEEILLSDGAISYKEKGVTRTKYSASGAQKTLIGIGMKLGLVGLTRSSFDSLLLDEISADMDPEISMRCALAINSFCGQSISISHRSMDVAGNVITLE